MLGGLSRDVVGIAIAVGGGLGDAVPVAELVDSPVLVVQDHAGRDDGDCANHLKITVYKLSLHILLEHKSPVDTLRGKNTICIIKH